MMQMILTWDTFQIMQPDENAVHCSCMLMGSSDEISGSVPCDFNGLWIRPLIEMYAHWTTAGK